MSKKLSAEQVAFYNANGFLGPIDLLTMDEAAELRRHIEQIEAKLGLKMMSRFRIKAHLPFPFLCDLVSHPKLLDAVEDLIGPDILCWGSSFFQKEPGDKTFVSWHQDSTYYGLEPPNTLTAWVAITEASIASGCMRFLPGSQGKGLYSHDELVEKDNLLSRGQTVKGIEPPPHRTIDPLCRSGRQGDQLSRRQRDAAAREAHAWLLAARDAA
jgi:non-haem Fe2+, alpha-ketoglutarate-dependent halogenase